MRECEVNERTLVITSHGIRTFGKWQERFASLIEARAIVQCKEVRVLNYTYPYFSALEYLIPWARKSVEQHFRREVLVAIRDYNPSALYFVGHSFGTEVIMRSLDEIVREGSSLTIRGVILSGSTLSETFAWDRIRLFDKGKVWLLNECGRRDIPLLISKLLRPTGGAAGRFGFRGLCGQYLFNRYFNFGHGGFFSESAGRNLLEDWCAYILDGKRPERINEEVSIITATQDSLASLFGLIRFSCAVSPLIALLVFAQFQSSESQRMAKKLADALQQITKERDDAMKAKANKDKQFSALSEQISWMLATVSGQKDFKPSHQKAFFEQLEKSISSNEVDPEQQEVRDKQHAAFYMIRGTCRKRDKRTNEALEDFNKAIQLIETKLPSLIKSERVVKQIAACARTNGAVLLADKGLDSEAIQWLVEAEALIPQSDVSAPSVILRDEIARCYSRFAERAGSDNEAIALYNANIERFKLNGFTQDNEEDRYWIYCRLGDLHVRLKRISLARGSYQKALKAIGYDSGNITQDQRHKFLAFHPVVSIGLTFTESDREELKQIAIEARPLASATVSVIQEMKSAGPDGFNELTSAHNSLLSYCAILFRAGMRDEILSYSKSCSEFYGAISPTKLTYQEKLGLAMLYLVEIMQTIPKIEPLRPEPVAEALKKALRRYQENPSLSLETIKSDAIKEILGSLLESEASLVDLQKKYDAILRDLEQLDESNKEIAEIRKISISYSPGTIYEGVKQSIDEVFKEFESKASTHVESQLP